MTDKEKIVTNLKKALDSLDITSNLRLVLIQTIEYLQEEPISKDFEEIEQRMKECPYRQVECTMYDGSIFECKGACNWVVDYLKLKGLKTQKGEEV